MNFPENSFQFVIFERMCRAAADLWGPGPYPNPEYMRGQVELIVNSIQWEQVPEKEEVHAFILSLAEEKYVRSTFTFTCVHPRDVAISSLAGAIQESYDGHAVGQTTEHRTTALTYEQAHELLYELGNDGTFFDDAKEDA